MAYFKVKNFAVYDITDPDHSFDFPINDEIKRFICYESYPLPNTKSQHYEPKGFINYLKFLSENNPNIKFKIYYKYIYYNHDHINEYQNQMVLFYNNNKQY